MVGWRSPQEEAEEEEEGGGIRPNQPAETEATEAPVRTDGKENRAAVPELLLVHLPGCGFLSSVARVER